MNSKELLAVAWVAIVCLLYFASNFLSSKYLGIALKPFGLELK